MIVEDEPPINRILQKLIEQSGEEFCIVASAYSGSEALDLLDEVRPDAVFTDIKMPGIDGIALTAQIRRLYPQMMVVVITGYGDYENMRAMLQHNVYDYLLKPVKPDVMEDLLQRIRSNCIENQMKSFSSLPLNMNAGSLPGYKNGVGRTLSDLHYQFMVPGIACMGAFPGSLIKNEIFSEDPWGHENIVSVLSLAQQEEGIFERWFLPGITNAERYVVLGFREKKPLAVSEACKITFKGTAQRFPLTMVFGNPTHSLEEVKKEFWRLRSLISLFIRIGESRLVVAAQEEAHLSVPDIDINSDKRALLSSYMKRGDYNMFSNMTDSIFTDFLEQRPSQYTLTRQLKSIVQELESLNPDQTCFDRYYSDLLVDQAILSSFDYKTLQAHFLDICSDVFRIIEAGKQKSTGLKDLVSEITYFLTDNYDKLITGKDLEEHFGFSSAYINQIFKKKKGLSPNKYLLQYRAKKACELIQYDPGITAKELARRLGIADELYLYKFFKKETGYTLSEYKTLIRNG